MLLTAAARRTAHVELDTGFRDLLGPKAWKAVMLFVPGGRLLKIYNNTEEYFKYLPDDTFI